MTMTWCSSSSVFLVLLPLPRNGHGAVVVSPLRHRLPWPCQISVTRQRSRCNDGIRHRHRHRHSTEAEAEAEQEEDEEVAEEDFQKVEHELPPPPLNLLHPRFLLPRAFLLAVSLCWGTYAPSLRFIYQQTHPPSPSLLTLARKVFSLSLFPIFLYLENKYGTLTDKQSRYTNEVGMLTKSGNEVSREETLELYKFLISTIGSEWTGALELGLWTFLGVAFQADGLENTTATRSGFLLQTVTVMVPMLAALSGTRIRLGTWIAAIVAFLGVSLMNVGSFDDLLQHLSMNSIHRGFAGLLDVETSSLKGDSEILVAALFYAICTVRTGRYAAESQPVQLTTKLMVVSTVLAAIWASLDLANNPFRQEDTLPLLFQYLVSPPILSAILFSALVPGAIASIGQTIGQKEVPAAEAQLYFSLQPFWSAFFASLLLGENLDSLDLIAGGLVVMSAVLASYDSVSASNSNK